MFDENVRLRIAQILITDKYSKFFQRLLNPNPTSKTDIMAESSGVTTESLTQTIKEKLGATHVEVMDNSGIIRNILTLPMTCTCLHDAIPQGGCGQILEAIIV